jgi:hypothetical protein
MRCTASCGAQFLTYLALRLGKNKLPLRPFGALFAFAAHEPVKPVKEKALQEFRRLIGRIRMSVAVQHGARNSNQPEAFMADLIWLCAHHPDFSVDVEAYKYCLSMFDFLLDALVATTPLQGPTTPGPNFPLLLLVVEEVGRSLAGVASSSFTQCARAQAQRSIDAVSPKSDAIYHTAELALAAVKHRYESKSWPASVPVRRPSFASRIGGQRRVRRADERTGGYFSLHVPAVRGTQARLSHVPPGGLRRLQEGGGRRRAGAEEAQGRQAGQRRHGDGRRGRQRGRRRRGEG